MQTKAWDELAPLYEAELGKMLDVPRQVDMLLAPRARLRGGARADREGDRDLPPRPRRRVRQPAPSSRSIGSISRRERWPELADILRREIRLAQNDAEIVALQFRLGQLFEQNLRDVDTAIEVYARS